MFAACEKPEKQERIFWSDIGYIRYRATIGYDFNSALDSLLKVAHKPIEPYVVDAEPLNVEYTANDRNFYVIAFKDTSNRIYLQSPGDVLDTKGDWYIIDWGED